MKTNVSLSELQKILKEVGASEPPDAGKIEPRSMEAVHEVPPETKIVVTLPSPPLVRPNNSSGAALIIPGLTGLMVLLVINQSLSAPWPWWLWVGLLVSTWMLVRGIGVAMNDHAGLRWPDPPPLMPPYDVAPRLSSLRAAIRNGWTVNIGYIDKEENVTSRKISPSSITNNVLEAHCHQVNDKRHFRLDRIVCLSVDAARQDAIDRHEISKASALRRYPELERFDARPRQTALSKALENNWPVTLCYLKRDGSREDFEMGPYDITHANRYNPASITYLTINQECVGIRRIVSIDVQAPDEKSRQLYSVREGRD